MFMLKCISNTSNGSAHKLSQRNAGNGIRRNRNYFNDSNNFSNHSTIMKQLTVVIMLLFTIKEAAAVTGESIDLIINSLLGKHVGRTLISAAVGQGASVLRKCVQSPNTSAADRPCMDTDVLTAVDGGAHCAANRRQIKQTNDKRIRRNIYRRKERTHILYSGESNRIERVSTTFQSVSISSLSAERSKPKPQPSHSHEACDPKQTDPITIITDFQRTLLGVRSLQPPNRGAEPRIRAASLANSLVRRPQRCKSNDSTAVRLCRLPAAISHSFCTFSLGVYFVFNYFANEICHPKYK